MCARFTGIIRHGAGTGKGFNRLLFHHSLPPGKNSRRAREADEKFASCPGLDPNSWEYGMTDNFRYMLRTPEDMQTPR
jgi:hypothetical protein